MSAVRKGDNVHSRKSQTTLAILGSFLLAGTAFAQNAQVPSLQTTTGRTEEGSDAQGDRGTNTSPLSRPAAPASLPNAGTEGGYLFNLRPLGLKFGQELADKGIYLTGRTLQQSISEVGGGIKRGTFYEGFNLLGVDLDLNRIAGINGASFHLLGNDLAGLPYQTFSGSIFVFNRAFAVGAGARLNEFSYEQSLFDNRLDLRVGRLPSQSDFDQSQTYCEFLYGVCAVPAGFVFDRGLPAYLTASTGGEAKLDLTHHFYLNAGAFEDEPRLALPGDTNLPGPDWDPSNARGVTFPLQFGYKTTFKDDPYPKNYFIGGFADTGDYSDPYLNVTGRSRAQFGGLAKVDHGRSGVYLAAEQVVYRPDPTKSRALSLFGNATFQTTGNSVIDNAYFFGFSYKGPFEVRPNDTLNGLVHVINLNNAYLTEVDQNLAVRRIRGTVSGAETYVEINYGLALAPGIVLKPSFDYIFNPDQVGVLPTATNRHAEFFGVAFSAFLPESLGLPRLGG